MSHSLTASRNLIGTRFIAFLVMSVAWLMTVRLSGAQQITIRSVVGTSAQSQGGSGSPGRASAPILAPVPAPQLATPASNLHGLFPQVSKSPTVGKEQATRPEVGTQITNVPSTEADQTGKRRGEGGSESTEPPQPVTDESAVESKSTSPRIARGLSMSDSKTPDESDASEGELLPAIRPRRLPSMIEQGMLEQGMIRQGMIQQGKKSSSMMQSDPVQSGRVQGDPVQGDPMQRSGGGSSKGKSLEYPSETIESQTAHWAIWPRLGWTIQPHRHPDDPYRVRSAHQFGQPLRGTSWRRRPLHVSFIVGSIFADDLLGGQLQQSHDWLGGFRLGWDFDHYYGVELRIASTEMALSNQNGIPLNRTAEHFYADVQWQYFPWGDTAIKPYVAIGTGLGVSRFQDVGLVGYQDTAFLLPISIGARIYMGRHFALRGELTNNLTFSTLHSSARQQPSLTLGVEYHFGGSQTKFDYY